MSYFWSLTLLVFCLAPAPLGLVLARRRPRAVRSLAGIATALVLLRALFARRPDVALACCGWDAYPALEVWWSIPVAGFLFGLTFRRLTSRGIRLAAAAVATLVACFAIAGAWAQATSHPERLLGRPDAEGFCPQSSMYSCGAAAGSSLLAARGVLATERVVAERSATSGLWGTTPCGLAIALRGLARTGWRCGKGDADWALTLPRPCAVTIAFSAVIDHWVVLERVEGDRLALLDPLEGRRELTAAEFRADFRGAAVWPAE